MAYIIKEYTEDFNILSEIEEATNTKSWYIEGITLQSDIKNRNGRIYPKDVMKEAISKYMSEFMDSGRAMGELNHPTENTASINLKEVSHSFVSITESGTDFITKAKVLDTPNGRIVKSLLEGGVKLGISSRGLGSIKEENGAKVVKDFYIVTLGDVVADPSAPKAFLNGVFESIEYELCENGCYVKKEVLESMDKYNNIIKDASKEELQDAIKSIFADFTKISLKK